VLNRNSYSDFRSEIGAALPAPILLSRTTDCCLKLAKLSDEADAQGALVHEGDYGLTQKPAPVTAPFATVSS
jgi:hypothetical protein